MKKEVLLFFLILSFSKIFCQKNIIHETFGNKIIDWKNISIDLPVSIKEQIIIENRILKEFLDYPHINSSHFIFTDFNNDQQLDVIIYYPKPSSEEGWEICILVKEEKEYRILLHEVGNLNIVKRETPLSPFYFQFFSVKNSGWPYTEAINEFLLYSKNGQVESTRNTFLVYEDVIIPKQKEFFIPFLITQEKYRLRTSPEIIDGTMRNSNELGNVIGEYTKGDYGYAFADSTDNTGRVWWFVLMVNNIVKDNKEFAHIDKNEKLKTDSKTFGWISSRFVRKIYE